MTGEYDLIIIGAGPAGLTAGLYAGRSGLKALILDKMFAGGQVLLTDSIENFPGFKNGIQSFELIENLSYQVKDVGVEIKQEEIIEIANNNLKLIKTNLSSYSAKSIIIATGAYPKKLGIKGENEFNAKGVSYCAVCDGALFKGKVVSVVGGGDRALEEALYLSKLVKKVYLIHRRDKFRAAKIIQDRVLSSSKIEIIYNSIVLSAQGTNKLEELSLKNVLTEKITDIKCDAVFVAIGLVPNTSFLRNTIKLDGNGFIVTDENFCVGIPGIFAAGDCRKNNLKQVVTACAEGAIAVNSVNQYLVGTEHCSVPTV